MCSSDLTAAILHSCYGLWSGGINTKGKCSTSPGRRCRCAGSGTNCWCGASGASVKGCSSSGGGVFRAVAMTGITGSCSRSSLTCSICSGVVPCSVVSSG